MHDEKFNVKENKRMYCTISTFKTDQLILQAYFDIVLYEVSILDTDIRIRENVFMHRDL